MDVKNESETKVKICGLTRMEDIRYVNQSNPDYIGFVFAKKSRRFITPTDAAKLKEQLNPSIQAVGVFVDETPVVVASLLNERTIDIAQLHGSEDEDYIKELRKLTNCPLIQAFKITNTTDIAPALCSTADYLLFDSATAGSGSVFDWSYLKDVKRPYFLAGGLNPDNIQDALENLNPFGVDTSSGVEIDQKKDNEKIRQFVGAVREWNRKE